VKRVVAALCGLGLVAGMLGTAVVGSAMTMFGDNVGPAPTTTAVDAIPPQMLTLYQDAAATCPGLPWAVLSAIGTVESDNGQSDLPGVHSAANGAGAEGPMQFLPATFSEYADPVPPGGAEPPSPYDPTDAVYAAARLLCANGGAGDGNITNAIFAYNHSASYVRRVLALAQSYGGVTASAADSFVPDAATVALQWALAEIGTPYVWGDETPGVGFDCSGLAQAAYAVAGVALPRVAQDQYNSTPKVAASTTLEPGDLVFFGGGPSSVDHVGLYAGVLDGQSVMVDAPSTGTEVRAEGFTSTVGAPFGGLVYVGATRPS
jgi:cell wall-associated NlpC family hydrolase